MSAHQIDVNPFIDGLATRKVPAQVQMGAIAAIVIGVATFGYGLATGNAHWAWGSYLTGLVYTLALAQGGVLFALIMTLTWGRWGRPLKRVGEAFGFFLPVGYLLLLFFLIAGNGLYPWHAGTFVVDEPISLAPHFEGTVASKEIWLSLPFFIGRQIFAFGLIILLDFLYIRASLRPDLIQAEARLKQSNPNFQPPGWWKLFTAAPGKLDEEVDSSDKAQGIFGVLIGALYPIVFSLLAFDLIMSLDPLWYANMFGAWTFVSAFWLALAGLGVYGLLMRDWLDIGSVLQRKTTHDLGKLVLAGCMFWAYTFYAQLLPIWYANMPEETGFLMLRLFHEDWAWLAQAVGVLCFLMPFTVLMSRGIKKMKWPFIGILSTIMLGLFLERTLLIMPSVHFEAFPFVLFVVVSFGVWIGFMGAFTLVVVNVMAKVPPVPVSDPKFQPHPWDIHVHPIAESGH